MNTTQKTISTFVLALAFLFAALANAGSAHVDVDEQGVILAGHDAVAYFTENAAVAGSPEFTATHNGAVYQFKSAQNRDLFNAKPDYYAPQFGGFCAYGTVFGKKFAVDGKAFEAVDNKLYVNKNLDVYESWQEDKIENIEAANIKWPNIVNTPASKL